MTVKKCQCGALTVTGEGFDNSMTKETFDREYPDLEAPDEAEHYCCNHCVNHWGLDLCACGSGEPVGECDGEFDECKAGSAFQTKGEAVPFVGWG